MKWGQDIGATPVEVTELDWPTEKAKQVVIGYYGALFILLEDGRIRGVDTHPYSAGGAGWPTSQAHVTGITNAVQITGGVNSTYALLSDGSVHSWGYLDSNLI